MNPDSERMKQLHQMFPTAKAIKGTVQITETNTQETIMSNENNEQNLLIEETTDTSTNWVEETTNVEKPEWDPEHRPEGWTDEDEQELVELTNGESKPSQLMQLGAGLVGNAAGLAVNGFTGCSRIAMLTGTITGGIAAALTIKAIDTENYVDLAKIAGAAFLTNVAVGQGTKLLFDKESGNVEYDEVITEVTGIPAPAVTETVESWA